MSLEKVNTYMRINLTRFYVLTNCLKYEIPKNGDLFIENIMGVRVLFWVVFRGDPDRLYLKGLKAHAESKGYKEFVDYDREHIVGLGLNETDVNKVVDVFSDEMEIERIYIKKCVNILCVKFKRFIARNFPFFLKYCSTCDKN